MDFGAVIARLKPSAGERMAADRAVRDFIKLLKVRGAKVSVGGSFGKATWIRGVYDIDLFVCFSYKQFSSKSGRLADFLEASLKSAGLNYTRLHGSRDYFEAKSGGFTF